MTIYCPNCKGILNHHTPPNCPNCGMATGFEKPVKPAWTAEKVTEPVTEPVEVVAETFTPSQMIAAIEQWLSFGEQMFNDGQHTGHFSGCGWAARALVAIREFIEKARTE